MNKKAYTQPRMKVIPMICRTMLVRSLYNEEAFTLQDDLDEDDR